MRDRCRYYHINQVLQPWVSPKGYMSKVPLVTRVVLLGGVGTFRRRSLVGGPEGTGGTPLMEAYPQIQDPPAPSSFPVASRSWGEWFCSTTHSHHDVLLLLHAQSNGANQLWTATSTTTYQNNPFSFWVNYLRYFDTGIKKLSNTPKWSNLANGINIGYLILYSLRWYNKMYP